MLQIVKSIAKWWDLVTALALKEIKQRYKQKYLRFGWTIISPIFTLLVFTLIFSRVAKLPSEGVPYPIFNFTALVPWAFFAICLNFGCKSLVINCNLITRLEFPRITIPISSILACFLDFVIALILLAFLFTIYHIDIGINVIYLIPVFLIQILFTLGVVFTLSICNAYLRDIQSSLSVIIQAWMLISPVGYSLNMVGEKLRFFYLLNPMAGILDSYRKILIHNRPPEFSYLLISFSISLVVFIFGYWLFKKLEPNLADIV